MRMQIFLSDAVAEQLVDLAWAAKRYPKQHAEWLLEQAVQGAMTQAPPEVPSGEGNQGRPRAMPTTPAGTDR